jgi:uncharacterized integral membrane protein
MNSKLTLILVISTIVVLFIIQNVAIVEIQFLFWSMQMSRSLLMFALLAIGIIIGWVLCSYLHHRKK